MNERVKVIEPTPEMTKLLLHLQDLGAHMIADHNMTPEAVAVIFANTAGFFVGCLWGARHEIDPRDIEAMVDTIRSQAELTHAGWNKERN